VTHALPGDALARLAEHCRVEVWTGELPPRREELAELASGCAGLITLGTDRVDAALLERLGELRVVANVAVGFDNLDVAALTARGIPAGNTPDVLTVATAELAFALVLGASRRLKEGIEAVRDGRWPVVGIDFLLGSELAGSRLGVVGAGRIGQAVMRRGLAFEMEVVAWSRSPRAIDGVCFLPLDELLASSDVVSLHVALNAETRHLLGRRELGLMKPTAVLVNTARGAVVDQVALYEALVTGGIAAAGLDVLEIEPAPLDEPLLALPNCLVLPHVGSATRRARAAMASLAVDNVLAGLAGRRLPACVNPEVYRDPPPEGPAAEHSEHSAAT
jgi:glyoxylate reductase